MKSNYDLQLQSAERGFLRYDMEEIAAQFSLRCDKSALYVTFLAESFRVDRRTGRITRETDGTPASFHAAMTMFDLLTRPHGLPALSGQWCAHEHFNAVRGGTLSGRLAVEPSSLAAPFTGRREELGRICGLLGGHDVPLGDYACILPLFPFFPVCLRFWDADEEFPAQLQILWDKNTDRYLHFETTFYATHAIFDRLLQLLILFLD